MTNRISTLLAGQFLMALLIFFCLILPKDVFGQAPVESTDYTDYYNHLKCDAKSVGVNSP